MGSVATLLQSHSSSSATSWASPVRVPCPISARAMRMRQVSSGRIATHRLISAGAAVRASCARPNGTCKPRARPPPAAAEPTMNWRRDRFGVLEVFFMRVSRSGFRLVLVQHGGAMHRRADALVGPAAADVGHGGVDVGIARIGVAGEKRGGGPDLARLAKAPLRPVHLGPCPLHRLGGLVL